MAILRGTVYLYYIDRRNSASEHNCHSILIELYPDELLVSRCCDAVYCCTQSTINTDRSIVCQSHGQVNIRLAKQSLLDDNAAETQVGVVRSGDNPQYHCKTLSIQCAIKSSGNTYIHVHRVDSKVNRLEKLKLASIQVLFQFNGIIILYSGGISKLEQV